jgi:3-oxoacyl-[acyl-carrier protein] reductase
MNLKIDGRVALVTGASRGIGLGIAKALAEEGVRVAMTSRSQERIEAAARAVGGTPFVHDASDLDGTGQLVADVERTLGPIDILILNGGGPPASPDQLSFTREQWQEAHRSILLSAMALLEHTLPGMRERGWGRIVSNSSTAVREPVKSIVLSTAHRSALLATFKDLARDVAGDGVTMNTVLPGRIETDRALAVYGTVENAVGPIPAGRMGTIEEMGATVAFLCSEPAAHITGQAIAVDGGLTHLI